MSELLKKLRFVPDISLGHVLQVALVIIPAIIYIVKLDARLVATEKAVDKLIQQDEKKTDTLSRLQKSQAVIEALFAAHQSAQTKTP